MTHHRSYQIPLHRQKPVPTAKVDPGPLFPARGRLRRESAEGKSELHQLNESVHWERAWLGAARPARVNYTLSMPKAQRRAI